ncbi:sodium-dependent phosphate transporter 2-like isoform X1 [Asterias amurensis]|uniref:sodium-dependent phosphate transporter 2-like isoform X1 n=1 Tax=Asterias amurensis TaxID=7602 RepID=UPI003AB83612
MDLPFVTSTLAPFDDSITWIVAVAFIISFVLAFGLGANDAANSFGTAVGAKVFTLTQALILASVFEMIGAIALGARVADTVRSGLFDPELYNGHEELLMVGQLSALTSACIWLMIATIIGIPVSASHSIVGASLGFHLVLFSGEGVDWFVIAKIVISWVASPVLSGIISCTIYFILKYTMLDRKDELKWGLMGIPFWYFFVVFINVFSIFLGVPQVAESTVLGPWLPVIIALTTGFWVSIGVVIFLIPYTRKRALAAEDAIRTTEHRVGYDNMGLDEGIVEIKNESYTPRNPDEDDGAGASTDRAQENQQNTGSSEADSPGSFSNGGVTAEEKESVEVDVDDTNEIIQTGKDSDDWKSVKDTPTVTKICAPLQGISACFAAFSHGGNDVSNAIGPLVGLYLIYENGRITQDSTPIWILIYGSVGIAIGLFVLGRRVIQTVGTELTPITPSTGFAINLGAAVTVLAASLLGIPVSTTHCLVGSVACVGFMRARKAMDFKLFTGIVSAWIVTLPVTVLLSAALMGLIQHAVPGGCNLVRMQYNGTNTSTTMAY